MEHHEIDRYGVYWGKEKQRLQNTTSRKLKNTTGYSSFKLDGTTYRLNDTVYLLASDGPPYIAKILTLYENLKTREKCMLVRWFCRPCELPLKAAGVNFKEDCKEIFMMWGSGSKIVINPACTVGKCKVVCTAPLEWNVPRPSEELIAEADYFFSFAFDGSILQVISLDVLVRQFGEFYVTGVEVESDKGKEKSGGSLRKAADMSDVIHEASRKIPRLDCSGPKSEPRLLERQKNVSPVHKYNVGPNAGVQSGTVFKNGGSPMKAVAMSALIEQAKLKKPLDFSVPKFQPSSLDRPNVSESSRKILSERHKNVSPASTPPDPIFKPNTTSNVVVVEMVENGATEKHVLPLPGAQNLFKMPWHKTLEIALDKGRALLLQNLDPWFSSSEIEGMLLELMEVACEARLLPPRDFSSYTSGEALVLFRNQSEAENAYAKFTENVLIWSEDQRPVVASLACKKRYEINRFHGFLDLAKFNPSKEQGRRGVTSQCAQPNTVGFEMGMQWRLLQERHCEAWNLAGKEC
ncbi:unnamed protein product [Calypogeia fissa]